jgi:hypothetical protein
MSNCCLFILFNKAALCCCRERAKRTLTHTIYKTPLSFSYYIAVYYFVSITTARSTLQKAIVSALSTHISCRCSQLDKEITLFDHTQYLIKFIEFNLDANVFLLTVESRWTPSAGMWKPEPRVFITILAPSSPSLQNFTRRLEDAKITTKRYKLTS